MQTPCTRCGTILRPGAKFCARCGQVLAPTAPPPYTPPAAPATPQTAAQQAAQAAVPAARAAGVAVWQVSKKGMGWFARLMTLGGRAAYTEIVSPQAAAEGQIVTAPVETPMAVPLEPAAWLFLAAWVLLPLLLWAAAQPVGQFAILAVGMLLLFVVNFAGLRQPAFSRLAFSRVFKRQNQRVPDLRFQINTAQRGPLTIFLVGPRRDGVTLSTSQLVRVYGTLAGAQLRAWKIEVHAADGQPLGTVTAPRVLPLAVTLFAPLGVWFVIWLLVLLIP